MPSSPLARLRLQLTAWYLAILVAILLLLGGGLFLAIRGQIADQLDRSLADATAEIARAAATRELEASTAHGQVVDAVEELRIPDRTLYLLDATASPVVPPRVPEHVALAAAQALRETEVRADYEVAADRTLRLRAERFALPSGVTMVAVAVADKVELEDRYASLIAAFSAAAVAALLLVAAGSWVLVRKSTRPAEQSMDRLRQFMADAAHELRTPITVLRSHADVTLQRTRDAATLVTTVQAMDAEARRLDRIVGDLLTLAQADSGERTIARARVSLDDIVLDAATAARPMASAKDVTLEVGEFGEAWVNGDPEFLRQLVMILLDNAIKFTPGGGSVRLAVGARDGSATVEIADTGVGIPEAVLPRIFDRFYRGDSARTRDTGVSGQHGGAGLGLSIAEWIATAHGADIRARSDTRGSTFTVTFPPAL